MCPLVDGGGWYWYYNHHFRAVNSLGLQGWQDNTGAHERTEIFWDTPPFRISGYKRKCINHNTV